MKVNYLTPFHPPIHSHEAMHNLSNNIIAAINQLGLEILLSSVIALISPSFIYITAAEAEAERQ
jgi:hypothetical protein